MSAPVCWVLVHGLDAGGVPAVLVRYLQWMRSAAGPDEAGRPRVHVIAGCGGRWAATVASLADSCTLLGPVGERSVADTVAVVAAELGRPAIGAATHDRLVRRRVRALPAPDVVLVHGAGAWPLWRSLAPAAGRCRLVLHLHELPVAISRSVVPEERTALAAEPDAIASVCPPDAGLVALLGGRATEVVVVPGCTELGEPPLPIAAPEGSTPAIVAVGEAGWRKGADRYEALAHELRRRRPEVGCRWIGAAPPAPWRLALGAPSPVRWEGSRADPWADVAAGSVLVLPAREDPLPLAALEAGTRGLPVVATGAGGLAELLADGRGWFVEDPDVRSLADAVEAVVDDPDEARRRAAALRSHIEAHLSPTAVGPRWLALLDGTASPPA